MDFLAFNSSHEGGINDRDDVDHKFKRDEAVPISRNTAVPWLQHEKSTNEARTFATGSAVTSPLVRLHNEILALCDLAAPTGE